MYLGVCLPRGEEKKDICGWEKKGKHDRARKRFSARDAVCMEDENLKPG